MLSQMILNAVIKDTEFAKKARPHIKPEYFQTQPEKTLFSLIDSFYNEYSVPPPKDSILVDLENVPGITEGDYDKTSSLVDTVYSNKFEYSTDWILKETEKFCRDQAIYNAIMASVKIIDGEDKKRSEGSIPELLSQALAVGFDVQIGHDYFDDIDNRYEYYHKSEVRHKTGLEILNKITSGGFPNKTLITLVAASGGGKSAVKCSLAADFIKDGKNVLYITLELAEERIAERIDANLLNIPIAEIRSLTSDAFKSKLSRLKEKSHGKLVIKEYPTGSASATHFNSLLHELKTKKGFVPDIVFVDYLQICASATHKNNSAMNTYNIQKYISEELRGFAVKNNICVITSVQTNRSGFNVSDFDESSIADSVGIVFTSDMVIGIVRTEEMKENKTVMFRQIKNRFGDPTYYQRFMCNMDTSRMKLWDMEEDPATVTQPKFSKKIEDVPIVKDQDMMSDWDFD